MGDPNRGRAGYPVRFKSLGDTAALPAALLAKGEMQMAESEVIARVIARIAELIRDETKRDYWRSKIERWERERSELLRARDPEQPFSLPDPFYPERGEEISTLDAYALLGALFDVMATGPARIVLPRLLETEALIGPFHSYLVLKVKIDCEEGAAQLKRMEPVFEERLGAVIADLEQAFPPQDDTGAAGEAREAMAKDSEPAMLFVFRPAGSVFEVKAFGEEGFYSTNGAGYVHRLVQSPGEPVSLFDLENAIGAGDGALGALATRIASVEADDVSSLSSFTNDTVIDDELLATWKARLERLKSEHATATQGGEDARIEKLDDQIRELQADIRRNTDRWGRPKKLSTEIGTISGKIRAACNRLIAEMQDKPPTMPKTAAHLKKCIRYPFGHVC